MRGRNKNISLGMSPFSQQISLMCSFLYSTVFSTVQSIVNCTLQCSVHHRCLGCLYTHGVVTSQPVKTKLALVFPNLMFSTRPFHGTMYKANNKNFRPPAQGVYRQNLAKLKIRVDLNMYHSNFWRVLICHFDVSHTPTSHPYVLCQSEAVQPRETHIW